MDLPIAEVYGLMAELAVTRGYGSIRGRCVTVKIDERWSAEINGAKSTVNGIPPYQMGFTFNGWPAGLISAAGGTIAAGEAANETTLIAAIKGAIEAAKA